MNGPLASLRLNIKVRALCSRPHRSTRLNTARHQHNSIQHRTTQPSTTEQPPSSIHRSAQHNSSQTPAHLRAEQSGAQSKQTSHQPARAEPALEPNMLHSISSVTNTHKAKHGDYSKLPILVLLVSGTSKRKCLKITELTTIINTQ